jgi:hypothetical protein
VVFRASGPFNDGNSGVIERKREIWWECVKRQPDKDEGRLVGMYLMEAGSV